MINAKKAKHGFEKKGERAKDSEICEFKWGLSEKERERERMGENELNELN